jgi:hypothetical protein
LEFPVKRQARKTVYNVPKKDFDVARKFAKQIYKEFQTFISAITVFGSVVTKQKNKDIDILIILDDVRIVLDQQLIQTYRIIVEKAILDIDPRLHVQTMRLTTFWEYIRAGDPVAINILRTSIAMIDTGFFDPLQALLDRGRIRPSAESIYTYFTMAPKGLFRARDHMLTAVMDLYWAAIDAAHAALMTVGSIPPSPKLVGKVLDEKMVKKGILNKKHVNTIDSLYAISKKITNRELRSISGKDYEKYQKMSEDFVTDVQHYLEKKANITKK